MSPRLHVLLVEDLNRPDSLASLLSQDGHDVRVVQETALNTQEDSPDVVILDIRATDTVNRLPLQNLRKRPLYVALSDEPAVESPGVDLQLPRTVAPEPLRHSLRRFREVVMAAE